MRKIVPSNGMEERKEERQEKGTEREKEVAISDRDLREERETESKRALDKSC